MWCQHCSGSSEPAGTRSWPTPVPQRALSDPGSFLGLCQHERDSTRSLLPLCGDSSPRHSISCYPNTRPPTTCCCEPARMPSRRILFPPRVISSPRESFKTLGLCFLRVSVANEKKAQSDAKRRFSAFSPFHQFSSFKVYFSRIQFACSNLSSSERSEREERFEGCEKLFSSLYRILPIQSTFRSFHHLHDAALREYKLQAEHSTSETKRVFTEL